MPVYNNADARQQTRSASSGHTTWQSADDYARFNRCWLVVLVPVVIVALWAFSIGASA